MRLNHFFLNESFRYENLNDISILRNRLIELEQLIEHAISHNDQIWAEINLYDVEIVEGKTIMDWAYEYGDDDGMEDLRWMLRGILNMAQSSEISDYSYIEVKSKIENNTPIENTALMCLINLNNNALYIHNISKWREAHIYYLQFCCDEQLFIERAKLCFENLFFHDRVVNSMATLSAPLNEYSTEIIKHLKTLNDEAQLIYQKYHHEGDQSMLDRLSVTASPERKPEIVRSKLTFDFINKQKQIVRVPCSPHTKLNGQMRKGNTKYLFDRIYFAWGDSNIEDGKILIAHIGRHRK